MPHIAVTIASGKRKDKELLANKIHSFVDDCCFHFKSPDFKF